jgi:hypothetical protein
MIEPLGLVVKPLGYRGMFTRWQSEEQRAGITSCEIVAVRLWEPFRELLPLVAAVG